MTMYVMPPDRRTDKDGRWYLRSGSIEDYYVVVISNWAPKGTMAKNLVPETIEISGEDVYEPIKLTVETVLSLLVWPPEDES